MKSALMAVAITALMGGLVVGPVTQQSAEAQVYGGVKALAGTPPTSGTTTDGGEVILVGHGGGKGGGGGRGGGKSFGSGGHSKAFSGGGHRGGSYAYRGGEPRIQGSRL